MRAIGTKLNAADLSELLKLPEPARVERFFISSYGDLRVEPELTVVITGLGDDQADGRGTVRIVSLLELLRLASHER